jgi:hypothetical protein
MVDRAEAKAWVDGWMSIAKEKAKLYREQGMSAEEADDRAVYEVRMEIRRGFTAGEAPGAISNGTPVVKVKSEIGDLNPVGATGTVLGSISGGDQGFGYFVAWDQLPNMPVFIAGFKIDRKPRQ